MGRKETEVERRGEEARERVVEEGWGDGWEGDRGGGGRVEGVLGMQRRERGER